MTDIEALLKRWQTAGVLQAGSAERIRAYESEYKQPVGLRWQGKIALILGALLLGCGVALFVSAHWDDIGPGARLAVVAGMIAVFHLAGGFTRTGFPGLSTSLHAVGTVAAGAGIGRGCRGRRPRLPSRGPGWRGFCIQAKNSWWHWTRSR